jgi:Leucine-rich repeat (LRR) protein
VKWRAGLEHLKGLTQLRELSLNGTQVTDAGLEHLKGLSELETLSLDDKRVTDAAPAALAELPDYPMVLTVAVAIPCSWLAVNLQQAKKQKTAVE